MPLTLAQAVHPSLTSVMVRNYASSPEVLQSPNLIQLQLESNRWFLESGLWELLEEVSPLTDFTGRLELRFAGTVNPADESKPLESLVGWVPRQDVVHQGRLLAEGLKPLSLESAAALRAAGLNGIPVRPYIFEPPKYSEEDCRTRQITYAAPIRVKTQLITKETGEVKEQDIFFGDFPLMTANGTFLINGAERVVVSQLVRSPGVYFSVEEDPATGHDLASAKLIPNRGAWLEFETSNKDVLSVKIDRKKRVLVTVLLRSFRGGTDEELLRLVEGVDTDPDRRYLRSTLERDPAKSQEEALLDLYRKLRPGEPPSQENARSLLRNLFSDPRRYDLGRVGRYKLNSRLGLSLPDSQRTLTFEDLVEIVRHLIRLNNGQDQADDIDHLGNRRIRGVGELIQNQFRIGLLRMERVVRERMSITDLEGATPGNLVNIRPVVAALREFFGGSQLSQFMDQTNPLAELTHKRRLSALGPGGLSRERAGFEVRDVHHSHYGRICPVETPEGPNIGLIGSMATYARINSYGFLETPYRRVWQALPSTDPRLVGQQLRAPLEGSEGTRLAEAGVKVTPELFQQLQQLPEQTVSIVPTVAPEIAYLSADIEEQYVIAQANTPLDKEGHFLLPRAEVRHGRQIRVESPDAVDYMDVSPKQIVSVATSLIPFLEHDDAIRALMGSNMQRQAVPLVRPEAPLVATGMERRVALDSGQVVVAQAAGLVVSATAGSIGVKEESGAIRFYPLRAFFRSNQGTCIHQRPIVFPGDRVETGQPLADSSSTDGGDLALGQNILVAFMSWEGYNFEDAIVLSEGVVREDKFSSMHVEKHEVEARTTKLGPEEITRDIPNVGEESLRDLDEEGVIRIGAEVGPGDILVGKITPKGETELTPEERLLRAIFGEKARDVKDTSLRVPHGEHGKIIDVRRIDRESHPELAAGVQQMIRVSIGQRRKIAAGDKIAGRHGNKGVISRILPIEDMPYLSDGTPVEMILNPIGVPSRMNLGQIFETHLGWAAHNLGFRAVSPVFDGATDTAIEDGLCRVWLAERADALRWDPEKSVNHSYDRQALAAWLVEQGEEGEKVVDGQIPGAAKRAALRLWLAEVAGVDVAGMTDAELSATADAIARERRLIPPTFGKMTLYDGRTGQPFDQPVTVGYIYMMKLVHLVEDKIHARSTGPYSLITQQPLGGKAQFGGQRFGEMEVWALEAYGAAHILQELLTVKSDDVAGRVKTYEAIVKGEDMHEPGVPESFKVLVKELQSLGLAVEVLNEEEERVMLMEESAMDLPVLGISLTDFERG